MMLESLFGPIRDLRPPLFTGNRDMVGSVYHRHAVKSLFGQSGISRPLLTGNRDKVGSVYHRYDVRVFVWSIRDLRPLFTGNRDKVGSVYHRYDVRVFVWSNQGCPGLYSTGNRDKVGSVYHRYDVRVFVWSIRDLQASTHWKQTRWVLFITDMMLESLFGPIRNLQASTHWKQRQDMMLESLFGLIRDLQASTHWKQRQGVLYITDMMLESFVWSNQGCPGLYSLETETRWVLYITDMMLESLFGLIWDLQASLTGNRDKGSPGLYSLETETRWVLYIPPDMMLESLFGPIRDLQPLFTGNRDKVGSVYHRYDVRSLCLVNQGMSRPLFTGNRDKVGSVYPYMMLESLFGQSGISGLYSLETETRWVLHIRHDVRVFVWSTQGSPGQSTHWKQETRWVLYITDMMLEFLFGPIRMSGLYSLETDKVGSVYHRYDVRVFVWSNQDLSRPLLTGNRQGGFCISQTCC
ncbi:unnamed protein product [Mytilus edulis]|uniref:Uncharacterized protein n=1 Tax=Mytilus edulis TaxID=6550 RepID=A0A8S3Q9A2_MYTED|nr:unnamed protein product [Mytilus edulis]